MQPLPQQPQQQREQQRARREPPTRPPTLTSKPTPEQQREHLQQAPQHSLLLQQDQQQRPLRYGCGVCDARGRGYLCSNCLCLLHQERRKQLAALGRKKAELLSLLGELSGSQRKARVQAAERSAAQCSVHDASAARESLQQRLNAARMSVEAARAANDCRRSALSARRAQLTSDRAAVAAHHPHLLRYQSLTLQHVASMLQREQRIKLKQVLGILPLKVEGMGGDGATSIFVSVCGLRTPDGAGALMERRGTPEATSAALGYLFLLLDLLGTYLGGPLLHEGSFQGSTTVIWRHASFWDRRPALPAAVLSLSTSDPQPSSTLVPSARSSTSGRWSLSLSLSPRSSSDLDSAARAGGTSNAALARAGCGMGAQAACVSGDTGRQDGGDGGGCARGGGSGGLGSGAAGDNSSGGGHSLAVGHSDDVTAAYQLLQRSVGCFVRALLAESVPVSGAEPGGVVLPHSWGIAAWLALLCEVRGWYGAAVRGVGVVWHGGGRRKVCTEEFWHGRLGRGQRRMAAWLALLFKVWSILSISSTPAGAVRGVDDMLRMGTGTAHLGRSVVQRILGC